RVAYVVDHAFNESQAPHLSDGLLPFKLVAKLPASGVPGRIGGKARLAVPPGPHLEVKLNLVFEIAVQLAATYEFAPPRPYFAQPDHPNPSWNRTHPARILRAGRRSRQRIVFWCAAGESEAHCHSGRRSRQKCPNSSARILRAMSLC